MNSKIISNLGLKMVTIYILELEKGKWYVGKTSNLDERLKKHMYNPDCVWTQKYKVQRLYKSFEGDSFDEDKWVVKMMSQHSIENVRGGSFSQLVLDKTTIEHLEKMIGGAEDRCFICNEKGHFASICKNKTKKVEEPQMEEYIVMLHCGRCNRRGHDHWNCKEKTDIWGTNIEVIEYFQRIRSECCTIL